MNKDSNARNLPPKKSVIRDKSTKKKTANQKFYFLSRFVPRSKKGVIRMSLAVIILLAIAGAIPIPYVFAKTIPVPFAVTKQASAGLELGDKKVLHEGTDGGKKVEIKSLQSV